MNISIINTRDSGGGASKAAFRLHKGLRKIGFNSKMLVRYKKSQNEHVIPIIPSGSLYKGEADIFNAIQRYFIDQNRTDISNTLFSFPYPGYDISSMEIICSSDVLNLHWVHSYQSIETISKLLTLDKPVVWTLHDQEPFTGGCHYSSGCKRYEKGCRNCPQLNFEYLDIPYNILKNKMANFDMKNLVIVTPSNWLAKCSSKSKLFSRIRTEIIPNSIEIDIFRPVSKHDAKISLDLDPNSKVLLFGADIDEKRKGFKKLLESLNILYYRIKSNNLRNNESIQLMCFGNLDDLSHQLPFPIKNLGYIDSELNLTKVYSAADIFLLPSIEDNLPNTILESMACGTPVVGFNIGGIPDILQNNHNGYLIDPFNIDDFANAIDDLLFNDNKRISMGKACINIIKNNYCLEIQAKRYADLFSDLNGKKFISSYGKSMEKSDQIMFDNFHSDFNNIFFELYRYAASKLIFEKEDYFREIINNLSQEKYSLKAELLKLNNIFDSISYKLGRLLTYIPRFIKSFFVN